MEYLWGNHFFMKPISIGIGFSDSGDAYKAAKDAQDMAGKPAEFAIVFASSNYDLIKHMK